MTQYYYASQVAKDREAAADVRQAIRDYNNDAPDKALKISSDDLTRSVQARQRVKKQHEAGVPLGKDTTGLGRYVEDLYQTDTK